MEVKRQWLLYWAQKLGYLTSKQAKNLAGSPVSVQQLIESKVLSQQQINDSRLFFIDTCLLQEAQKLNLLDATAANDLIKKNIALFQEKQNFSFCLQKNVEIKVLEDIATELHKQNTITDSDIEEFSKIIAKDGTQKTGSAENLLKDIHSYKQFNRYKIIEEIGKGGMGRVFRAFDPELNREVALKILLGGEMADDIAKQRFFREAKAMAKLCHPNIINVHDIGEEREIPFFTMDLVKGGSLRDIIESLNFRQTAEMIRKIALAVHDAHQQGVIHRDLKPGNILIDENDEPKVMDFGLAKISHEKSDLSKSGLIVGTLKYMSPEQASGKIETIDRRADVYSLGTILYEALCKRPVFSGTSMELLYKIVEKEPVPPTKIDPKIPSDLESICIKALDKTPKKRYKSASLLAKDLNNFLQFRPILAKPTTLTTRVIKFTKRYPLVVAMIAILAMSGLICAALYVKASNSEQIAKDNAIEAKKHAIRARDNAAKAKKDEIKALITLAVFYIKERDIAVDSTLQEIETKLREFEVESKTGNDEIDQQNDFSSEKTILKHLKKYATLFLPQKKIEKYDEMEIIPSSFVRQPSLRYFSSRMGKIWDSEQKKIIVEGSDVSTITAFSPDDTKFVAIENGTGKITIYDLPSGKILKQKTYMTDPTRLAFSKDNKYLAVLYYRSRHNNNLFVYQVSNLQPILSKKFVGNDLAFSHDGKSLVVVGSRIPLTFFNLENSEEQTFNKTVARRVALSKNDEKVITASLYDIVVYSNKSDKGDYEKNILTRAHTGEIDKLLISPDNQFFVSFGNKNIVLWDMNDYQKILKIPRKMSLEHTNYANFHQKSLYVFDRRNSYSYQRTSKQLRVYYRAGPQYDTIRKMYKWAESTDLSNRKTSTDAIETISHTGRYIAIRFLDKLYLFDMKQEKLDIIQEHIFDSNALIAFDREQSLYLLLHKGKEKQEMYRWELSTLKKTSFQIDTSMVIWGIHQQYLGILDRQNFFKLYRLSHGREATVWKNLKTGNPEEQRLFRSFAINGQKLIILFHGYLQIWDFATQKKTRCKNKFNQL